VPSCETLSFEGASTRSCVSRKILLTAGLDNMPSSELGQFLPPSFVAGMEELARRPDAKARQSLRAF
jgi:hypothetical protein